MGYGGQGKGLGAGKETIWSKGGGDSARAASGVSRFRIATLFPGRVTTPRAAPQAESVYLMNDT